MFSSPEQKKFENPQEEIAFLREQIAQKEQSLQESGFEKPREEISREVVDAYKQTDAKDMLHESMHQTPQEHEQLVLKLSPEEHDSTIEELFGVMLEKGVKNALDVVASMGNRHIEDDFHRFLVQYLHETGHIDGLREKDPMFKALNMTLFEVTLPEAEDGQSFKEFLGAMEQFYAGMQSVAQAQGRDEKNHYTIEVALANDTHQVVVYVAVPRQRVDLFEKQVLAFYREAKVLETKDDYNVFTYNGVTKASYATFAKPEVFPIQTHDKIDHDPMNSILNTFSKLKKIGEGAAIQYVISPVGQSQINRMKSILDDVRKGDKVKNAVKNYGGFEKDIRRIGKHLLFGKSIKEQEEEGEVDSDAVEQITQKLGSTISEVSIRMVASADTDQRALDILHELESSFNQFDNILGNRFIFERVKGKELEMLVHNFTFRMVSGKKTLPMNLKELASIFHFPVGVASAPQLKEAKAGIAPAPQTFTDEGIVLGVNHYRDLHTQIRMTAKDRLRHMYVIGQTGTGKTTILKNMIAQDIANGEGCCFIDPHGSDIEDILSYIPEERIDDVIYFDPASTERPMGLNMLEYDVTKPEQKTFVVDEMLSIFNKLFDMKTAGGPMFEQYFRNATMLVLEDPDSGSTLLDISRVLADEEFRKMKLSRCRNPVVLQFWNNVASKAGGEASLQNIVPYIVSKFDVFMSNEIMRPIIAQQESAFNFRKVMDEKKILLVNLSKGRLGEINANLIGLIMVGKLLMAALSRVDTPDDQRAPFYLYIDEFQNVTTNAISQILSEARKYKLSLNIAHQFIAQLDEGIKNSVFGNVGSMAVFRVGADDAAYLESQFSPVFDQKDLIQLENWNAYMKMLVNGEPVKPFNIKTLAPPEGKRDIVPHLKELSAIQYGRPRAEVEQEILERFKAF